MFLIICSPSTCPASFSLTSHRMSCAQSHDRFHLIGKRLGRVVFFLPFSLSNSFCYCRLSSLAQFSAKPSLILSVRMYCISLCGTLYFTAPRIMMSSLYFWSYQIACVLLENGNHVTIMFISLCIVSSHIAFHTAVNCLMISLITPRMNNIL